MWVHQAVRASSFAASVEVEGAFCDLGKNLCRFAPDTCLTPDSALFSTQFGVLAPAKQHAADYGQISFADCACRHHRSGGDRGEGCAAACLLSAQGLASLSRVGAGTCRTTCVRGRWMLQPRLLSSGDEFSVGAPAAATKHGIDWRPCRLCPRCSARSRNPCQFFPPSLSRSSCFPTRLISQSR